MKFISISKKKFQWKNFKVLFKLSFSDIVLLDFYANYNMHNLELEVLRVYQGLFYAHLLFRNLLLYPIIIFNILLRPLIHQGRISLISLITFILKNPGTFNS